MGNLLTVNDSINGTNAGITGYTYDLLNRVTKLTQGGTGVQTKRVDMAYNAVNQLTSLSRFSGVNGVVDTSYVYDNNQRLIKLAHVKGASTVASYDYGYDNADKLASTISSVDGTSNYSYDSTNQLTGTDHSSQTDEAYSYDANGNRTSGGTVTGVNNQLLNDGTYSYTYDGEGNRTRRTEIATGKVTEYIWDYRNRLASVLFKDAGGSVTKTIDYIYDGNNQRIGKRIDGALTERYVIDRNQIALVFDGAGVQTHRYLYGTQVDQVLADETGVSTNWMLGDNQGTIRDVVNGNGSLINHVVYDSFGKVQSQSNAGYDLRFGYTGREQDSETGLDYYRARYYDASNGRFISEDPIGFAAGDGNLYRYVFNSPVNHTDPSGLRTEIYIHSGSHFYGHAAINIDGTVYTFGRYSGADPKAMTGGTIGEGYLYLVNEKYYLNSEVFTPIEDRINRFDLNLSPAEERAMEERFRYIFNNNTKKNNGKYYKEQILLKQGFSAGAYGRILEDDYNFLLNNCAQTVFSSLPPRASNDIGIRAQGRSNVLPLFSPPHLKDLLSSYKAPMNSYEVIFGVQNQLQVTELLPIQPGKRSYGKLK